MADIERRFVDLQTTITGRKLGGYGAVFNTLTDLGPCLEVLEPNAFRSVLASQDDFVALLDHDMSQLLARTKNGSLRLSTDSHGLEFELDLNLDTTLGNDVRAKVDSGLLSACSVGFRPGEFRWDTHEGRDLWVQTSVAWLRDVSVVTLPQYPETSVSLRSKSTTPAIDGRTQLFRARFAAHNYRKVSN